MRRSSFRVAASLLCAALGPGLAAAASTGPVVGPTAGQAEVLYLAVTINGAATRRVAAFRRRSDGGVAATRAELADIGIDSGDGNPDALVDLATLPGLGYQVDDVTQEIFFTASDHALRPAIFDAAAPQRVPSPASGFGSVVNYNLFATTGEDIRTWFDFGRSEPAFSGAIDARVFGHYGVVSQSATASAGLTGIGDIVRLDTVWSYSDPRSLRTFRAGDVISGGLSWTRPIRLGGAQVQRDFGLRPDLITLPVPDFSASAAVPSTVEVYANNMRVFRTDVPAGPFVITNIPVVTGAGTARVAVSDSLGRETVTEMPFYSSPVQLRGGLYDFSFEAGVPRRSYGVHSNDYAGSLAGSGSVRYGVSDDLTVEAHAEVSEDVVNAGAGAAFSLGNFGVASLAGAASRDGEGDTGGLFAAALEAGFAGLTFHARTRRAFGDYADLASASTRGIAGADGAATRLASPPRSVSQAGIGVALPACRARFALNYTELEDADGETFRTAGLTFSRPLGRRASLYATGFREIGGEENYGIFAGLTFALGDRVSGTVSASSGPGATAGGIDISRSEQPHAGSYGWRLRDREGDAPDRLASLSYRARPARLRGSVRQFGDAVRASAEVDGAVVLAGGGVFFTPRIDDAFVLVDVGAPDVAVYRENRLAGVTDRNGQLVVPGLNAYEANTLTIDPENLPLDAQIANTREEVVPADRSGVTIDFGVDTEVRTARVILRDTRGEVLPPGASGRLVETGEDFIVGYDGLAFLRGVGARNTAEVALPGGGSCRADLPPRPRGRQAAGTVEATCR